MSTQAWTESRVRELHADLVSLYEPVDRVAEHGADPTAEPGEGVRQLLGTILSQNVADTNTRSLAFLDAMATADAKEWLMDIKGVGPKTASVVLNFHFGKPTMAVDTHVERVSKRFGLVPESASNERAHDVLDSVIPDELIYPLHVLLIRHGREHCAARGADCVNPVCETYCDCSHCP